MASTFTYVSVSDEGDVYGLCGGVADPTEAAATMASDGFKVPYARRA